MQGALVTVAALAGAPVSGSCHIYSATSFPVSRVRPESRNWEPSCTDYGVLDQQQDAGCRSSQIYQMHH